MHLWQRGVLDDETCGCGNPFSRCPFWQEVGDRAFPGWPASLARRMVELQPRVDRTRHVPALALGIHPGTRRTDLMEYVTTFVRLYQAISDATGGAVLIAPASTPRWPSACGPTTGSIFGSSTSSGTAEGSAIPGPRKCAARSPRRARR